MEDETAAIQQGVHFDAIGQIAVTVSDLARAKDFYQNKLGMKFLFDAGSMSFFQCGNIRLLIGTQETATPRGGTILYFRVRNIKETHALFKAWNLLESLTW